MRFPGGRNASDVVRFTKAPPKASRVSAARDDLHDLRRSRKDDALEIVAMEEPAPEPDVKAPGYFSPSPSSPAISRFNDASYVADIRAKTAKISEQGGSSKADRSVRASIAEMGIRFVSPEDRRLQQEEEMVKRQTQESTTLNLTAPEGTPAIDSPKFALCVGFLVFVNMITIGLETELSGEWGNTASAINTGLLLFYIMELLMRFLTHGYEAFKDLQVSLDLITCVIVLVERTTSVSSRSRSLISLRMARIMSIFRTLKQINFSKEFRLLINNAQKLFKTDAWAVLIILIVNFCCAVVTVSVIGDSGEWAGSMDPIAEYGAFQSFDNMEYFGSTLRSFFTYIQITTVSQWSRNVVRPIMSKYPSTWIFFFFLIFTTTYGIASTIVASMVQNTLEVGASIERAKTQMAKENSRTIARKILQVIEMVDEDKDGGLSAWEIDTAYEKYPEFAECLEELGVPLVDGESMVRMLDISGDGVISCSELHECIISMDDLLQSRDYIRIHLRVWSAEKKIQHLQFKLSKLENTIKDLKQFLTASFDTTRQFLADKAKAREEREMYQQAIAAVRRQSLRSPLSVKDAFRRELGDGRSEADAFIDFAERNCGSVLTGPSKAKYPARPPVRCGSGGEVLGDAPPSRRQALRDLARAPNLDRDRYSEYRFFGKTPGVNLAWIEERL